jgi:hypothetical protein
MNSKKAKQMRRMGRGLTKSDKRMYNKLNHHERHVLGVLYTEIERRNKEALSEDS